MPTLVGDAETARTKAPAAPFTNNPAAMSVVSTIFFMWGLITVLNDILIPHLKMIFRLNYTQAMLVQFCFFSAYFVFAAPFGKVVEKVGFQATMVIGLVIAGVGALLFWPSAVVASFPLFLGALIVLAAGITGLQVSANPYVALLGQPVTASSRLNLAQALNSLGTTIAPTLGGLLIFSAAGKAMAPAQEAHSVILPYLGLAGVLFALAIGLAMFHLPKFGQAAAGKNSGGLGAIKGYRHTMLGVVAIFVYVGAEVSIGSFLVNYFGQKDIGDLTALAAAKFVSLYWGGAMAGRFIGSIVLRRARAETALGVVALAAMVLVTTSMLLYGHAAMAAIILVGLFNSIMFPNIFTLGIAGLGELTGEASGLLVAAIVGGAIIPVLQGGIADRIGIHHAFILPILCYIYIAYYGFAGAKVVIPEGRHSAG